MPRARAVAPERSRAFAPLLGEAPWLLILGSLPGAASLAAGQYYAHPRNLFWDFMGELFGAGPDLPYAARTLVLQAGGVAVWDVLCDAIRPGSLDADIELASARHNDLASLLWRHPSIRLVAFNGGTAARLFRQRIAPHLTGRQPALATLTLPSTSPAHAGLGRRQKLLRWRELTRYRPERSP